MMSGRNHEAKQTVKYSISLGSTGYTRHMTNSLLTDHKDGKFTLEVLFEGVPVSYTFTNIGISRSPETFTGEDWAKLSRSFDHAVTEHIQSALWAIGQRRNHDCETAPITLQPKPIPASLD